MDKLLLQLYLTLSALESSNTRLDIDNYKIVYISPLSDLSYHCHVK